MPKFTPVKPFSLFEDGSHYGKKSKNSQFLSDMTKQHIEHGAPLINVYRLRGVFDQDSDALGIKHNTTGGTEKSTDIESFMGIQDTVLGENRDREYDFDEIPRLRGVYTVSQNELEYLRFGMALANDIITLEFHAETMEKECGRRLIAGDVMEFPHLREVGIDGRIANKWYEVSSITWSPSGYDPMYNRHILAVILKPLRHQQEFLDLFERTDEYGKTLADQTSTLDSMLGITEANQKLAREHANTTWYDTTIMYFDPDNPDCSPNRWTDDGIPDNGAPVEQGGEFPSNAAEGSWFLRTDLVPNRLYRLQGNKWRLREVDRKREWQPYNWIEKLREHMSDRSEEDRSRGWELRSIHDVITDREYRSDPTKDEDNR